MSTIFLVSLGDFIILVIRQSSFVIVEFCKKGEEMKVVVRALLRWGWILILCVIIGWLGGRQLVTLMPPMYQATAIVHLNAQSRSGGASAQIVQSVAAYAAMATSDEVLGTVMKSYPSLNRLLLSKQLLVTPDTNGQNIALAMSLPRPKMAASFANDLARLFVAQQNAAIKLNYDKQLKLLDDTIASEQKQIDVFNQKIVQAPSTDTTLIQQY